MDFFFNNFEMWEDYPQVKPIPSQDRYSKSEVVPTKMIPVTVPATVCHRLWLWVRIRAQATRGIISKAGVADQPNMTTMKVDRPEMAVV